jgi:hypothetical protein
MKNRSTTFIIILSVFACFGLLPRAQAQEGDIGGGNTVEGFDALLSLTTGGFNTALGWGSQAFLTDAFFNTGVGAGTLVFNDTANNTAVGAGALLLNTTGFECNAVGVNALNTNDSGAFNNAAGGFALFSNFDGSQNNAFGDLALTDNVSGSFNTAMGDDALLSCTGNSNTALGDEAGANVGAGEGNIYIGAGVPAGSSGEFEFIRIGNDTAFTFPYDTFIAGIFNRDVSLATAVAVFVDDTGKLGTNLVDANGNKVATPQAMLNESRNQQKRIAELESTVARLAGMVKEQAAQIQKVSAQLEVSKPAPQVVANKP